jgi:hypothetical protein
METRASGTTWPYFVYMYTSTGQISGRRWEVRPLLHRQAIVSPLIPYMWGIHTRTINMSRLDYSSVDEQVISTNPLLHGLSPPSTSDLWPHSANVSAEFSAYVDLGSRSPLNFSDLPAQQVPALINRSLILDQEVDQFPNAQNNSDVRQNSRLHDSQTWFTWALGRNVFSEADVPMAFSILPVSEW